MNIDPQEVRTFRVHFDAGNMIPPPFHYTYELQVNLAEEDSGEDSIISYEVRYLHREELTEDEILDEGFTLHDDWAWKGNLPLHWQKALLSQIEKQSWPKKPEKIEEGEAGLLISLIGKDEQVLFEGVPADIGSWEYFLQELIQAVYELAQREAPFELTYLEVDRGNETYQIELKASFAERSIRARELQDDQELKSIQADWKLLKNLMKNIYIPDYDYENAREQTPKKRGKYLYTGEGLWFKFGESLTEPDPKSNSLERLEGSLKELFGG